MKIITKAVLDMETMQWVSVESYEYGGPVDLCCGPSSTEEALQSQGQGFSQLLQSNYSTLFGNQMGVLNSINRSLSPIVAAGPNQQGFSAPELANLQTAAINNTGAAAKSAMQVARTFGAGEGGGGTSGLTSGVTKQIESSIASQQAGNLANQETGITQADYNQGNANYWRALGGAESLAGEMNPNGAMTGATNANQGAFGEASAINEQNNALGQDFAGFATALAGSAGQIAKAFQGGSSSNSGSY